MNRIWSNIDIDLTRSGFFRIQDSAKRRHRRGNFRRRLLVRLQRYRLQAESFRIDIQIFVSYEKEIILPCRAKFAQSREDNRLAGLQNMTHLVEELADNARSSLDIEIIAFRVKVDEKAVVSSTLLPETQPLIRRIYGISLVRENRRNHLGDECSDAGQRDFIFVKNQFLDHFGQEIYIHINFRLRKCPLKATLLKRL